MIKRSFAIWVVYDHPDDDPNFYLARQWVVSAGNFTPTTNTVRARHIEDIREKMMHMDLFRIDRDPSDEPSVLEQWL